MDPTHSPRPRLLKRRAARLASAAGREPAADVAGRMVEQLEPRIVLAGDHASIGDFMNATMLMPDGAGEAVRAGVLEVEGDDDMFAFVMPSVSGSATTDFVTVIADAINSPGTLDTRVTVYDSALNIIGSGSTVGPVINGPESTDGWFGFVATEGETYFIQVTSDQATGPDAVGDYRLRIDAATSGTVINTGGIIDEGGQTDRRNDDEVFRIVMPSTGNTMVPVVAWTSDQNIDTRLDIFDANGTLISSDSGNGTETDAYAPFFGRKDRSYYVRVRSDQFGPLASSPSFGTFSLVAFTESNPITVDQVQRDFAETLTIGSETGVMDPTFPQYQTQTIEFVAPRSGDAQFSAYTTALPYGAGTRGVIDPTIEVFDSRGDVVGFDDDGFLPPSTAARLRVALTGGETYYVIVTSFPAAADIGTTAVASGWDYDLRIDAGIVAETTPAIDDHASGTDFANATPIVFGEPQTGSGVFFQGGMLVFAPATDHSQIVVGSATGFLDDGDSDLFVVTPPVDMLGSYAGEEADDMDMDGQPDGWTFRPSERLSIIAEPVFEPDQDVVPVPFGQTLPFVEFFDSRGVLIGSGEFNLLSEYFGPNEANGVIDPGLWPPGTMAAPGFEVWGGQAYYIRISNTLGDDRYNIKVIASAGLDTSDPANFDPVFGDLIDGDSGLGSLHSFYTEAPQAGDFTDATRSKINLGGGTGAGRIADVFDGAYGRQLVDGINPISFERVVLYGTSGVIFTPPIQDATGFAAAEGDVALVQEGALGSIEHPLDTDLYSFTAVRDGPIEIRILTTGLQDEFRETVVTGEVMTVNMVDTIVDGVEVQDPITTTYDSLLDSHIRVFDGGGGLIAENDDSGVISGDSDVQSVGTLGDFTFQRRDARVIVNAVQGQTYFVQVESADRERFAANKTNPTLPVNWRNLTGSYDLLIAGLPSDPSVLPVTDDYTNFIGFAAPIALAADGSGSIEGRISNDISTPDDFDLFRLTGQVSGLVTVSLASITPQFVGEIFVYSPDGTAIVLGAPGADVEFALQQGEQVLVQIRGIDGSQGDYRVEVASGAVVDDHADLARLSDATRIPFVTFLDSVTATGTIESPGDTDVFYFEALNYDDITIRVDAVNSGFDPAFVVYETTLQPSIDGGTRFNNVLTFVAGNDDESDSSASAAATFGITPDRFSPDSGLSYPRYYIVVRGQDADEGVGDYQVRIEYKSTDDHADLDDLDVTDEFDLETPITLVPSTGFGSSAGVKEVVTDTDVFSFVATASGTARVDIDAADGNFLPAFQVFNRNAVEISTTFVDGGDQLTFGEFAVTRGETYYVSVGFSQFAIGNERRGSYTIDVQAPPVDDHANAGELDIATVINISPVSGDGQVGNNNPSNPSNPRIDPAGDTDLFTFTPLAKGDTNIVVTPFFDSGMPIQARVTLLSPNGVALQTATSVVAGQSVTLSLPGLGVRQFFLLVEDVSGTRTGGYTLSIDGPAPVVDPDGGGGGGGGDADFVDFADPTVLALDKRTGDGEADGSIGVSGDRDLFLFTPVGAGITRVQVVTPDGSTLDASITILRFADESPQSVIRLDTDGLPGATAATQFDARRNTSYYAIVDGIGTDVGDYTLRVNAQPATSTLYLPDAGTEAGRLSNLAITNPNDFRVSYRAWLRYADGTTEVISNGRIDGRNQTLVQLSAPDGTSPVGAKVGVPYSIEIWSNGQLSASVISYDGRADTGGQFTETLASTWDFARIERRPGVENDTITVFNPNAVAVDVTLTGYQNGTTTSVVRRVEALQRTTWSINSLTSFPTGVFSARVSAAPADAAQANKFMGVVAGLRSENLATQSGFGVLGNPDITATSGVLGSLENGSAVNAELVVFNPGDTDITFQFTGDYFSNTLPDAQRIFTVAARSQVVLSGAQVGLAANQAAGISYTASGPVSVVAVEDRLGETNARVGQTTGVTQLAFAGASLNTATLGTQSFGWLNLHNPTDVNGRATVQLIFADGTVSSFRPFVGAGEFVSIDLAARPEITARVGIPRFGLNVFAPVQITASLTQYDLALGGGWTIAGTPFGLTNSISSVQA